MQDYILFVATTRCLIYKKPIYDFLPAPNSSQPVIEL